MEADISLSVRLRFRVRRVCRAVFFFLLPPAVPMVLGDGLGSLGVPFALRMVALFIGTFVFALFWRRRRGAEPLRVALPQARRRALARVDTPAKLHAETPDNWFAKYGIEAGHDVVLVSPGVRKIHVIGAVRRLTGMGLKEAKDLIDTAPGLVMTRVTSERADRARELLESLGATVTVSTASEAR